MEPVSRRSFLVRGSAGRRRRRRHRSRDHRPRRRRRRRAADRGGARRPRPARDPSGARRATAEVELLVGEREVVFTDKELVAKVLRATR